VGLGFGFWLLAFGLPALVVMNKTPVRRKKFTGPIGLQDGNASWKQF
jgi:hypothetical protein